MNSEKCDRLTNGVIVAECGPAQAYEGVGHKKRSSAYEEKKVVNNL